MPDEQLPEDVRRNTEAALAGVNPVPFSPVAFDRFKGKVVQYIAELYEQSIKISHRHGTDSVSASHVERAAESLVAVGTSVIARHVGTLGGLLAGLGGSQFVSMLSANTYTAEGVAISVVCGALGCAGMAWHFAKER